MNLTVDMQVLCDHFVSADVNRAQRLSSLRHEAAAKGIWAAMGKR